MLLQMTVMMKTSVMTIVMSVVSVVVTYSVGDALKKYDRDRDANKRTRLL